MSYKIRITDDVESAVREIAQEQIEKGARELKNEDVPFHERIHEVRKRLKRVRGLLRLVRPSLGAGYSEGNAYFRDLGRRLARLRDAGAMVESVEALLKHSSVPVETGALEEVRTALLKRRARLSEHSPADETTESVSAELARAKELTVQWQLDSNGFKTVAGGLSKSYARGRSALERAYQENSEEAFHDWRKRVKYHRYHVRLLRGLWPRPMNARRDEAKLLADFLGDDHDLAVLRAYLSNETDNDIAHSSRRAALAATERRGAELRALARPLGEKLFAEKPKEHVKRLRRLWKAEDS